MRKSRFSEAQIIGMIKGQHWEGDLLLFKQKLGQTNVTSLVERVSRFIVILKNPNKRTIPADLLFCGELPVRLAFDLFQMSVSRSIRPCLRSHLVSLQG